MASITLKNIFNSVELKKTANTILKYLKLSRRKDTTSLVYTDGECDSVQTKFENLSNHLKIGVRATSFKEATILLRFLRLIIDDNSMVLVPCEMINAESVGIYEYITQLSEENCTYVTPHIDENNISVKLHSWCGSEITLKTILTSSDEMDIWTLERLQSHFDNAGNFYNFEEICDGKCVVPELLK